MLDRLNEKTGKQIEWLKPPLKTEKRTQSWTRANNREQEIKQTKNSELEHKMGNMSKY